MPHSATLWTVEMVNALPDDGRRREVIDGELFVSPAPSMRHQRGQFELGVQLKAYVDAKRAGLVLLAPLDITFSPITNVQPDIMVFPLVEGRAPESWAEAGRLLLAAEVLSPSTAYLDRGKKRRLYQRQGVPEYWIVDVDARVIERWRPDDDRPEVLDGVLTWLPEGQVEPFTLDLHEFFGSLAG